MPAPIPTPAPDGAASQIGNLLLVDDDPVVLERLRECLGDDGYRILAAASVGNALTILAGCRVDLILTDAFRETRNPTRNPWSGLDRLRAAAGDTPVVILSAHARRSFVGYAERGFAGLVL